MEDKLIFVIIAVFGGTLAWAMRINATVSSLLTKIDLLSDRLSEIREHIFQIVHLEERIDSLSKRVEKIEDMLKNATTGFKRDS